MKRFVFFPVVSSLIVIFTHNLLFAGPINIIFKKPIYCSPENTEMVFLFFSKENPTRFLRICQQYPTFQISNSPKKHGRFLHSTVLPHGQAATPRFTMSTMNVKAAEFLRLLLPMPAFTPTIFSMTTC